MALETDSPDAETSLAQAANRVLPLIDLTLLGDDDTEADVVQLCDAALTAHGSVASVCIWPQFVEIAGQKLAGSGVDVCAVANFPLGANDPELAVSDARAIVGAGGREVDVVIPWHELAAGERGQARYLVTAVREAIGPRVVIKAILETGELQDPDLIAVAAREAIAGGADFLKTSTGKTQHSATPEAASVLLEVIHEHKDRTDRDVGLKISGGVKTVQQASVYLTLADEAMGEAWVGPETLRFGASSLLSDVLEQLGS